MAPKTITVVDASGGESKEMLSNEEGYKNLVAEYRVASLKDSNGAKIRDFGSLVDGGKYTLGDISQRLERQDDDIEDVVQYARMQMQEAKTLVLSKMKSSRYRKVTHDLGLKLVGAKWSERPDRLIDIDPFTWYSSEEDSQQNREGYMAFLRGNVQWPAGYAITDSSEFKDLLSITDLDGDIKTSGNIDVVLATQENVDNGTIRQNIRAGIELKKIEDKGDHENQVVMQHLAASLLNPSESVLTVMTDLNERWHFYWFGVQRGRLYKCIVRRRSEAKFLFERLFDSPDSIDATTLFPTDFLVRGTWSTFLGSDLTEIGESETNDRSDDGGASQASKCPRRDGSGCPRSHQDDKGEQKDGSRSEGSHGNHMSGNICYMDVANELDLLDFVDDDEEKRAIQLRFLAKHVVPKMTYVPDQNHLVAEGEEHDVLSEANVSFHNASGSR